MTFDAYHATDQNNAVLIQYEGFKFHHNDEHWLGNGVYFFIDEALAKKWVEKQPKSFNKIKNGVVLHVVIDVDESFILDLRNYDDYMIVKEYFEEYVKILEQEDDLSIYCSNKKLLCTIFDELKKEYELQCVISNFSERSNTLPKQLKDKREELWRSFHMPFVETQICVFDTSCIILIHNEENKGGIMS